MHATPMHATGDTPLLRLAHRPPVACSPAATVQEAVAAMLEHRVGAVVVLEDSRLAGIFTERDLMVKVVAEGRDPTRTALRDVMVARPVTVRADTRRAEALQRMIDGHFRHLPVTDASGRVLGTLSIRQLLQHQIQRVSEERDALEAYMAADGPGG
jgi:CBS domain-containing protein